VQTKIGVSALSIQRITGVNYATAWLLLQRMRAAMDQAGDKRLSGDVEFDETYVGAWTLELQGAHAGRNPGRGRLRGRLGRPHGPHPPRSIARRFALAIADFWSRAWNPLRADL